MEPPGYTALVASVGLLDVIAFLYGVVCEFWLILCAHRVELVLLIPMLVLEVDFIIFTSFLTELIGKLLLFCLVVFCYSFDRGDEGLRF